MNTKNKFFVSYDNLSIECCQHRLVKQIYSYWFKFSLKYYITGFGTRVENPQAGINNVYIVKLTEMNVIMKSNKCL